MRRHLLILTAIAVIVFTTAGAALANPSRLAVKQGPRCVVAVSTIGLYPDEHVTRNRIRLQYKRSGRWRTYAATSARPASVQIRLKSCRRDLRHYPRRVIADQEKTDTSGTATLGFTPISRLR